MPRLIVVLSLFAVLALAPQNLSADTQDLLVLPSPHSALETADKFEAAIKAKGLKVFPRIDHAAAAKEYGLDMPPTIVLSFGNPKYGTPFMLKNQQAGIDFPPRAIVYEDADGKVFIAINTASHLYAAFDRHGLEYPPEHPQGFQKAVEAFAKAAVAE